MSDFTIIDTKMHGHGGLTAAFVVHADGTALVETGPKSSVDAVLAALEDAAVDELDWIVVTHVHLDHAGAAGAIAERFPGAHVAVHRVGAPHLVDPSKLWASAARIYGDDMERLWGGIDPIPAERIVALDDGDRVDLGGRSLVAVDTPGHAYHHHAFLDDATGALFAGDALGVRLGDLGVLRPATPPPEFHLEKAVESIRRIAALEPSTALLTHFGPQDSGTAPMSVGDVCDEAERALLQWAAWVRAARRRTGDRDEVVELVKAEARAALEEGLSQDAVARLEQTTSYAMNVWGYMRYLDKVQSG